MKTIIVTEGALNAACHPDFPFSEVVDGVPPDTFANVGIQEDGDITVIATANCSVNDRLLVIGGKASKFSDVLDRGTYSTFFERCVRLALRSFDKRIALSPNWMPYRQDNRSSVFASGTSTLRIIAEQNYGGSKHTFVFDLLEATESRNLQIANPDPISFDTALQALPKLIDAIIAGPAPEGDAIELDWVGTEHLVKGFAYDEWLPLLSSQQRGLLKREVKGPLRVRGAAGTGKTLAMVMKALKIAKDAEPDPKRILFLTHSWAMAGQVDEMINTIGRDIPAASLIDVYPLMEMSRQRDYSQVGRHPLGLDSESGKRAALDVIESLLNDFIASDWVAYRGGSSGTFIARIEAGEKTKDRRNLAWDLLNEFGCVFAAEGMLGRQSDRERYLRVRRMGYMMKLENQIEKEVVFALWSKFLGHLKENGLIATDQIISDYLNELQTFYWEAKRGKEGYDYIFVDEMHLFNAQERLVFHNLLADGDVVPNVVMALDPKQSPREVFADIVDTSDTKNRSIYERAHLPNPEKVDFVDVYRYTEQIAALIKTVLDAVPALDIGEDWELPGGSSVSGEGPKPQYFVETDALTVFKRSMTVARKLQTDARKRKGQVAVLCLDYDRFSTFQNAASGQYPDDVFVVKSRDDVERLRFMNRRIIYSTPEYVAGLQFDSVVIVDANANLVPDGPFRGPSERRFLSELYLGMSRAEHVLVVIASRDSDGLTPYLEQSTGSLLIPG